MAKLYPPYLEGTLPAFSLDDKGNGVMTIPFTFNRATNVANVTSAKIKIKTVQNDVLLASVKAADCGGRYEVLDADANGQVTFYITNWKLYEDENLFSFKIGQYYKIQLAFFDEDGNEGYYSTVGVIKCTSDPIVKIVGFENTEINKNAPEFIGYFEQGEGKDVTEKVYSSKFEIFYPDGTLAYTSGDLLHNIQNDSKEYIATETYAFNRDVPDDEIYSIKYTVTTTNGLVKSSPLYFIANIQTYDTTVEGNLVAELNYDEGYVDLYLHNEEGVEFSNGMYVISREDSLNPGYWEELYKFSINNEMVESKILFKDFYIEQGKYYTYSLQQYNEQGLFTNRKKSNLIYADFEDIFLYDGTRQLKLRFNPQVTSFKTQLAEARSETIGSKYPFFFRNARIGYKSFPITGLISMLSDDNELFTTYEEINREDLREHRHDNEHDHNSYKYTDLVSRNLQSERLFKLKVLDWLNNGQVKLFKSPAEGNYLVRLMDVSLSPEKSLGRMLHNVTMTAYECADLNRNNYIKYGVLKEIPAEEVYSQITSLKQQSLLDISFKDGHSNNLFFADRKGAFTTSIRLFDLKPGTKVQLVFNQDGLFIPGEPINRNNGLIITIGATGNYIADDITPIYGIYILGSADGINNVFMGTSPTISYMGEDNYRNEFNLMENIHTNIGVAKQLVGATEKPILQELQTLEGIDVSKKEEVFYINQIDIFSRPIKYVYYEGDISSFTPDENVWGTIVDDQDDENFGYFSQSRADLYLDYESNPTLFTHKNMMDFAPFAFYVVKGLTIDDNNVFDHQFKLDKNNHYISELDHDYQHILEKYFIDRLLMATTAEEELVNKSLAYAQLALEDNQEIREMLDAEPLYVIDGWNGNVYKVGENFIYDPSFQYGDENISIAELEKYTLNSLDAKSLDVLLNNGVYANIYYQKTTTDYVLENSSTDTDFISIRQKYIDALDAYNGDVANKKVLTWEEKNARLRKPGGLLEIYSKYIAELTRVLNDYMSKK